MSGLLKNLLESNKCHYCMKKINYRKQNLWSHFIWEKTEGKKHPIIQYEYCKDCYDTFHKKEKPKGLEKSNLPCNVCTHPLGNYSWYHTRMYRRGGKLNDVYFIRVCEECYVNLGEDVIDNRFRK